MKGCRCQRGGLRVERRPAGAGEPAGRGQGDGARSTRRRAVHRPLPDRAAAVAACHAAGAADRRAGPHRRFLRGLSAGGAVGIPDHDSEAGDRQGRRAAAGGDHRSRDCTTHRRSLPRRPCPPTWTPTPVGPRHRGCARHRPVRPSHRQVRRRAAPTTRPEATPGSATRPARRFSPPRSTTASPDLPRSRAARRRRSANP